MKVKPAVNNGNQHLIMTSLLSDSEESGKGGLENYSGIKINRKYANEYQARKREIELRRSIITLVIKN